MDDRCVRQQPVGARLMVVGHDDVDAGGAGCGDLLDCGDRAVDGDQQAGAAFRQPLDRAQRKAVAVLDATRQEPVDVPAEAAQRTHEDRRRADAVDVVVAVDRDACPAAHMREDQRDRVIDPRERARRVCLVGAEERTRSDRLRQSAPHEHLRERAADAERRAQCLDRSRIARCQRKPPSRRRLRRRGGSSG